MTFKEWVDKTFGANGGGKAARFLGISYRTFRSYYACERFPHTNNCQVIVLKSRNEIDVQRWQQDYINKKKKKVSA
mgnify:CR=1 FL=1|tara:strand:- start:2320 stop:2547 length:228 start_codon:yes stop_codon:yes gene_type:complete